MHLRDAHHGEEKEKKKDNQYKLKKATAITIGLMKMQVALAFIVQRSHDKKELTNTHVLKEQPQDEKPEISLLKMI